MRKSGGDHGIGRHVEVLFLTVRSGATSWRTSCDPKNTRLFPLEIENLLIIICEKNQQISKLIISLIK
jgi:hypothetical protein